MHFRRASRRDVNPLEFLDALMDGYVHWRDANRAVAETYHHWSLATRGDRERAFASYAAALDHEEHAAHCYRQLIEGSDAAPVDGGNSGSKAHLDRPVQPGTLTPWVGRR